MADEAAWYYLRDGDSVGPEPKKRLLELLDQGAVTRQTLVWREGAADWRSLDESLGLSANAPPALPGAQSSATPPGMPPIPPHSEGSPPEPISETRYPDYSPHPWRRYFARMLDTTVGAAVVMFAIGVVLVAIDQDASKAFTDYLDKSDNRAINSLLTVAIAMLPNALLIGFTGSSLGKWIFGVSVTHLDGRLLGFRLALKREAMVWWRGLGIGFPLIALFTLISAFRTLKEKKKTSWDEELLLKVVHRPATATQMVLNFVGIALWLTILVSLVALNSA
jgi:uncharacterized RDD family membrane protein YckC